MIKKLIGAVLCAVLLMGSIVCFAQDVIRVELDGAPMTFDQEPLIVNDSTMVPVRAIFEALGAAVEWDPETRTVFSQTDTTTVSLTIDEPVMTVNGVSKQLVVSPMIAGGRTLVPVRAVSEGFGCTVEWRDSERLVRIFTQTWKERAEDAEPFGCVKQLTNGEIKANVAFGLSYFTDYEIKKNTADGTDVEILYTSEIGHASLNVRTDLYTGADEIITKDYAQTIAEELVTVLSGTLVSCDVITLGETEFAKIVYTAPGVMHGITDYDPEIAVYITRKNGVVYTMTYTLYGEVEPEVTRDFAYMLHSMLIA